MPWSPYVYKWEACVDQVRADGFAGVRYDGQQAASLGHSGG